jgi:hypothetical protein
MIVPYVWWQVPVKHPRRHSTNTTLSYRARDSTARIG